MKTVDTVESSMQAKSLVAQYLDKRDGMNIDSGAIAFYASLDVVRKVSPLVVDRIVRELHDQRTNLKLIASENYSSLAVQLAQGNLFTDKYAEGYPGHRFYAGCDNVDAIEEEAVRLACALFQAEHAYVQPHSGADANLVAFLAILAAKVQTPVLEQLGQDDPQKVSREDWAKVREATHNQRLLALDYYSGGHLTHGYRHNVSSHLFDVYTYTVEAESKLLDLEKLRAQLHEVRPLILLAGYSAYPRKINFARMRELADEVGAVFMVDMAHFAGLVAGGVFSGDFNPVAFAHVVTSTTHKTLRGPRGGLVLCNKDFAPFVDKGCPLILGGPLPQVLAAKAVAFREANSPEFKQYSQSIVNNAQALAQACIDLNMHVLTGGTDNHLMLVDVAKSYGLSGRQAESALRECGITLNRNALPFDANGPWYTSGLRLGTPAVTTLGMSTADMKEIAALIHRVLSNTSIAITSKGEQSRARYNLDTAIAQEVPDHVRALLRKYPVYPELDLELLMPPVAAGT